MLGENRILFVISLVSIPYVSVHIVVQLCQQLSHNLDQVVIDTKVPLHPPRNYLTRRSSSKKSSGSENQNKAVYMGQSVRETFKPT